jgi:hypothetical protein
MCTETTVLSKTQIKLTLNTQLGYIHPPTLYHFISNMFRLIHIFASGFACLPPGPQACIPVSASQLLRGFLPLSVSALQPVFQSD